MIVLAINIAAVEYTIYGMHAQSTLSLSIYNPNIRTPFTFHEYKFQHSVPTAIVCIHLYLHVCIMYYVCSMFCMVYGCSIVHVLALCDNHDQLGNRAYSTRVDSNIVMKNNYIIMTEIN